MAIIKTYDISTVEEVIKIHELTAHYQEQHKYDEYSKENIMLVRTTDQFPTNRILQTLANSFFIMKNSMNFICSYINYYGLERLNIPENPREISKKVETYEMGYRSTMHFTENGIVVSHDYGNFDNRPFIILEPLIEQLDKSDIRNFAGQDTFMKGNVTLSDKAIIIINTEEYDNLKGQYPEIDEFNIITYNGIPKEIKEQYIKDHEYELPEFNVNDHRAVVEIALMDLGYVPELVGTKYLIESPTSAKVNKVNQELAEEKQVTYWTNHCNTEDFKEDHEKGLIITQKFNKLLLDFIIKRHALDPLMFEGQQISYYTAEFLIQNLGIEAIIDDVEAFNKTIEKMQEHHLLPTGEELLNNARVDIYTNYEALNIENDAELKQ